MKYSGPSLLQRLFNRFFITPFRYTLTRKEYLRDICSIEFVLENHLSYLDKTALLELFLAVKRLEEQNVEGAFIEAGCALGGSAIVITSAKAKTRHMFVYDTFGMIPPPSENDEEDSIKRYDAIIRGETKGISGDIYYGYLDDLQERVIGSFARALHSVGENNVRLIKGLFENTLQIDQPIAFAHIDSDWYDSVMVCLDRIFPYLSKNGIIVVDDYYHWSGCRKAVNEFFADKKDLVNFNEKSRFHITKLV